MNKSVLIILFIASFLFASNDDFEEAVIQEDEYCEKVKDGTWGVYKPEINCGGEE